ncbi:MAG TPA: hypothetical protein VH079_02670 [Terriglobales bacterium]|nr:hypothetical protein [Terriglobales bacterium]
MNEKRRVSKQDSGRELASSSATAALVGAAAGLAGGCAMSLFSWLWAKLSASPSEPLSYGSEEWDTASKVAKTCAKRISGRNLSLGETKTAAAVVHYAIAGATGVLYAMALQTGMFKPRWSGAFFGVGMWLVGNELLLPALGVIKRKDYDTTQRANALGEHLAFGLTANLICRQLLPGPAKTE